MKLPTDESSFFQILKDETTSSIYWERLELKTDSGFPDSHFVLRPDYRAQTLGLTPALFAISGMGSVEGTIEFKFNRTKGEPNLRALMEATQKANFFEYVLAGGRRRFLLCCNGAGTVHLYTAKHVCEILRGVRTEASSSADLYDKEFPVRSWLPAMLEMNW